LIFYISRGKTATYLREKRYTSNVANFLLNAAVKEFLISSDICESYERL